MTKQNNGGPAFAHGNPQDGGDPGMSLRDWFAGQATDMDVSVHQEWGKYKNGIQYKKYTREQCKYLYANAMLRAREE